LVFGGSPLYDFWIGIQKIEKTITNTSMSTKTAKQFDRIYGLKKADGIWDCCAAKPKLYAKCYLPLKVEGCWIIVGGFGHEGENGESIQKIKRFDYLLIFTHTVKPKTFNCFT
jgi:hypothetical protein